MQRRLWAVASAGGVLASMLLVASCGTDNGQTSATRATDGTDDIVMSHGADRLPNHTASDWVTYADHVVVVTAESERELPATEEERKAGEGYLPREVTLEVMDTVWSRDGAAKPAPDPDFTWPADGWAFDGDGKTRMAMEDQPRIELGHTYIMALVWEPEFTDGAETIPGQWRGLGENSVLPYDGGVIGNGESEGSEQAAAKSEDSDGGPDGPSIEDAMNGKSVADLAGALNTAQPTVRQDFGPES